MSACCILFKIRPVKGKSGQPDYVDPAKKMMSSMSFLADLKNFEKDNVDASVLSKLKKLTSNPDFNVASMKSASAACASLCGWVLAIVEYHA